MAPPEKKTFREWEKVVGGIESSSRQDNRDGSNGGGLESLPPPVVPNKMVCPHCQREFKNTFALGGHIRIHKRKIKFTHIKCSRRKRQDLFHGFLTPVKKRQCRRDEQQQPPEVIILSDSSSELGYDADVEDEYGSHDIMERLRGYDINFSAHKIERTGKMYMCIPCQVSMLTFLDVLIHTDAREFL